MLDCNDTTQTMSDDIDSRTVWQDREIRFDVRLNQLTLRRSEFEIDSINSVEDTKGNNGEKGQLIITNLRIIWLSHSDVKTNLSIGYNCILSHKVSNVQSKLNGNNSSALYIMTKYNNSRFEFIFTSLVKNSPRLFTSISSTIKSYETTRLYRELKLRGAIIHNKNLLLLPDEQVYNIVDNVWNLSSDQGNLGCLYITNIRIVWFAGLAENFNVSIPYIQISNVKIKDSKFGYALVIETSRMSGGYVLGFRIDPINKLNNVKQEIDNMYSIYSDNPILGIKVSNENKPIHNIVPLQRIIDDIQITQVNNKIDNNKSNATINTYTLYSDYNDITGNCSDSNKQPVYNEELGLAVEKINNTNITIKDLWNVIC